MPLFLHKNKNYSIRYILIYLILITSCCLVGCNSEGLSDSTKTDLVSQLIEDKKVPTDTNATSCDSYITSNAPLPSTIHYLYRIGVSERYVLVVFDEVDSNKYHLDCKIVSWDGVKTREVGNENIPDWKSSSSFDVYYENTKNGYEEYIPD